MFSDSYEFCGFVLDPALRELRLDEAVVPVEKRVLDLLLFLVMNHDRVVTKDEIQDAVWPGTIVTETALTRAIMKARRAVGDSADAQAVIRTIHGQGYRFVADVSIASAKPAPVVTSSRSWRWPAVAAGFAVIALFAGWLLNNGQAPQVPATAPAAQPVIAVLPFENLSPDPEHAYFATGIQEEILNEIARDTSLLVMARTSVAQYAGTTKTIPEIAKELGVAAVVEGSVRYTDNRVRITAQLIDGHTGLHMWSNSYDRAFADIFKIQEDIASKVAGALEARILGRRTSEPLAGSVDAYREYLLARSLRYRTFEVGWKPVLEHVQRSLAFDPNFIPSLGILHNAYQNRMIGDAGSDAFQQMRAITARAVTRDPRHSITLAMRAKDAAYAWQWQTALSLWDQAIAADPSDPDNLGDAAFMNIGVGRYDAADALLRASEKVNRQHDWPYYAGMLLKMARHDETGFVETGDLIISMGGNRAFPAAMTLAFHNAALGRPDAVARYGQTINKMTGGSLARFVDAMVEHARGRHMTRALIDAALAESPPPNNYKWMGTQGYLLAGDIDAAAATLEDIANSHALLSVLRIVSDPAFDALRNHPRYRAFLEQVGLASYSKTDA